MEDIFSIITSVRPSLRLCAITRQQDKACGFHLSRTQWDPYPWISNVDEQSPAAAAGLTIGDFVIEVNGEDILGMKIDEVAQKVRMKSDAVRLLVWKSAAGETENRLSAIFNLHKFSSFLQSALQIIECPICMEVASSTTYQCNNGHILCISCRQKTLKCPMCRVPLTGKGRCLTVEKLHGLIKSTLSNSSECEPNRPKEISDNNDSVLFCCPYSEPCEMKLKGEQAVLHHITTCHNGPIIQYCFRSDFVTVSIPSHPFALTINRYDAVFFLRILPTRECWISVLGDMSKAVNYQFSIQYNETEYSDCVSLLSHTTDYVLSHGKYFNLPILLDNINIKIQEIKGISTD